MVFSMSSRHHKNNMYMNRIVRQLIMIEDMTKFKIPFEMWPPLTIENIQILYFSKIEYILHQPLTYGRPKILRETKHSCFFSAKMSSLPPHLDYVSLYQTRTAKKKEKKNRAINLSQG